MLAFPTGPLDAGASARPPRLRGPALALVVSVAALLAAVQAGSPPGAPGVSPSLDAANGPAGSMAPLSASPGCQPAGDDFEVVVVDPTRQAQEPTLTYGPDGTVYYSGMSLVGGDASLWKRAPGAAFEYENPPTTGGIDATVYHDGSRLFFAEQGLWVWTNLEADLLSPNASVGLTGDGSTRLSIAARPDPPNPHDWGQVFNYQPEDRMWMVRASTTTHVVFGSIEGKDIPLVSEAHHVGLDYVYLPENDTWAPFARIEGWRMAESIALGTGDVMGLGKDGHSDTFAVVSQAPDRWREEALFTMAFNESYGLPRIVAAGPDRLHVLLGGNDGPDESPGLWLRTLVRADGAWQVVGLTKLNAQGTVAALPSAIAAGDRLGVLWLEAEALLDVPPGQAPPTTVWNAVYRLFDVSDPHQAHPLRCWILDANALRGPLTGPLGVGPGEFTYVIRQPDDPEGKAALAWVHQIDPAACADCQTATPVPLFGLQLAGPGVGP